MGYHLQRRQTLANLEMRAAAAEKSMFRIQAKRMAVTERRNKLSDDIQILKRMEDAAKLKLATLNLSITGLSTALAYKAQRIKELTGVEDDTDRIHGLAPAPLTGFVRRSSVQETEGEDLDAGARVFAQVVATQVDCAEDHSDAAVGRHGQDQGGVQRGR